MKRPSWIFGSVIASCSLITANQSAHAQQSPAADTPATPVPTATSNASTGTADLQEVVVHGIRRGELILPTTVTSDSAYGMDLSVMDTPRNTTVISKAQLDALNIQNPGGFSYLTSSSYSDASFGQPNVPRIRGQYGDMFFNGMRDSFTLNGYGAPISFNSVDSIDIVKGPASVQAGPGAGVGGAIDITTKMPSFSTSTASFDLEGDSQQKRRASLDIGGPLTSSVAARLSVESDDSGSYYYDMFFHQQSIFASVLTEFSPRFSVLITGDYEDTRYRENDGVNRVNQNLIDNGAYLTGSPDPDETFNYLTPVQLSGATVQLPGRVIIDEPDGNGAHSQHAKGQIIQTFSAADNFTIVNNTFYDYLNRYNQVEAYYADTSKGSFTIENKTDFNVSFSTGSVQHQIDAGFTYRYAHVDDIQDFANEPVGIFDLSGNPNTFVFPPALMADGESYPYLAAFNHPQYGDPGRDPIFANVSVDSDLKDGAVFLEHRITFSPQWSVMYGLRGDIVQLDEADPLGGAGYSLFGSPVLPVSEKTPAYGLHNGNISVVYTPTEHVSTYLTYNNAQYVQPTANDGAVGTFPAGFPGGYPAPFPADSSLQLRQGTELEEAGLKLDLLDKSLFISTAIFKQSREISTGLGNSSSTAHIKGAEIELNYQPDPHFFATASYSYLHTVLDAFPPGVGSFYNFPAYAGLNVDGAGNFVVYQPGQQLIDPGVPQHLFNVLANYKHSSGFGVQGNIQVTGPMYTTTPGYLDMAMTNSLFTAGTFGDFGATPLVGPGGLVPLSIVNANGYYSPPRIPWQFTVNTAIFYTFGPTKNYTVKFTVYNLTDEHNLQNDVPYYGNDFITRIPPRSFDVNISAKF